MKALFFKELRMTIHPVFYLFPFFSALMFLPGYAPTIGVSYALLGVYGSFNMGRINKDLEFTALLPVSRKSQVFSKYFLAFFIEALHLIAFIPFAALYALILHPGEDGPGIAPNSACIGFLLIALGVFNLIFLPAFFKTGYKIGLPMFFGALGYAAALGILETTTALLPELKQVLDSFEPSSLVFRLLALCAGLGFFAGTTWLSFRLSVKNFERVNL
jgi:hypothetical protein